MSTSGPSREELAQYFKNSRQYFDQLAKHYQETDPEYYKEYIQPFYDNPFMANTSGKGCRLSAISLGVVLVLVMAAGVMFFILNVDSTDEDEPESITERAEKVENERKIDFINLKKQADSLLFMEYDANDKNYLDFEKSVEERLLEIKKDDKNYKESQNLLKKIREHRIKKKKSRSLLN